MAKIDLGVDERVWRRQARAVYGDIIKQFEQEKKARKGQRTKA